MRALANIPRMDVADGLESKTCASPGFARLKKHNHWWYALKVRLSRGGFGHAAIAVGGDQQKALLNFSQPGACNLKQNYYRWFMRVRSIAFAISILITACSSTRATLIPEMASNEPKIGIVPFSGLYGPQTVDLMSEEFAKRGIATIKGARVVQNYTSIDTDLSDGGADTVKALRQYGQTLDVDFVFAGSVEPSESISLGFRRVRIDMRLIDVESGQTRWFGSYGKSLWTPATSTQADIARGARHIVKAFDRSGADDLVQ